MGIAETDGLPKSYAGTETGIAGTDCVAKDVADEGAVKTKEDAYSKRRPSPTPKAKGAKETVGLELLAEAIFKTVTETRQSGKTSLISTETAVAGVMRVDEV